MNGDGPADEKRRIGFHTSIAGGVHLAVERASKLGANTLQIFTHNPRGWKSRPLTDEETEKTKAGCASLDVRPLFVHASYLINLASTDPAVWGKSAALLGEEMLRASALGARGVALHTGSAAMIGREEGWKLLVGGLVRGLEGVAGDASETTLLFENSPGKRGDLTPRLEDLAELREEVGRLLPGLETGVCLDTCHAFVAGYDLSTEEGGEGFSNRAVELFGKEAVMLLHLNDSRGECGSGLDRHADIGGGRIGLEGLGRFLNDPFFRDIPTVLETPRETDEDDKRNLGTVLSLIEGH